MKTPVEELFELLWDTPKDKFTWYAIRNRMVKKEKEAIMDAYDYGFSDAKSNHDHNKRILLRNP